MSKNRIMIIDDETEYVKDLSKGLQILGYEVYAATTGEEGIALINSKKPDLVLCDYKLEDMDGTKILEITKPHNPETIFVIVTAYYDETFNEIFTRAGADHVIYKPIQLIEVDESIRKWLGV
jgi:two-component system response regulator HydG